MNNALYENIYDAQKFGYLERNRAIESIVRKNQELNSETKQSCIEENFRFGVDIFQKTTENGNGTSKIYDTLEKILEIAKDRSVQIPPDLLENYSRRKEIFVKEVNIWTAA